MADSLQWVELARASQLRIRIRTFKDLANQVELFIAEVLKVWLTRFPQIVDEKSITLSAILESNDLTELKAQAISQAVDAAVLGRMMGKPAKWFVFLKQHLGCTLDPKAVTRFIERKAARDVLEHHGGAVDASYCEKAGAAAEFAVGDLIEPDDDEIDALYDLIAVLIKQISGDAVNKLAALEAQESVGGI